MKGIFFFISLIFIFKTDSINQESTQEEYIITCKVIARLTKESLDKKNDHQTILLINTFDHLKKKVADKGKIGQSIAYIEDVKKNNQKNNVSYCYSFSENAIPFNLVTLYSVAGGKGWTHQEVDNFINILENKKLNITDLERTIKLKENGTFYSPLLDFKINSK